MTKMEFLKAVAENRVNEEVVGKALELIETEGKVSEAALAKKAEHQAAVDAAVDTLIAALTDAPQTATQLIEAAGNPMVGDKPVTRQAVATYFSRYAQGRFSKTKFVPDGEKTEKTGYVLPTEG